MFISVLTDAFFFLPRAYHSSITSHGLENQILFLDSIYRASCSFLLSSCLFQNHKPQLEEEMRKPDLPCGIWVGFSISFRKEWPSSSPLPDVQIRISQNFRSGSSLDYFKGTRCCFSLRSVFILSRKVFRARGRELQGWKLSVLSLSPSNFTLAGIPLCLLRNVPPF